MSKKQLKVEEGRIYLYPILERFRDGEDIKTILIYHKICIGVDHNIWQSRKWYKLFLNIKSYNRKRNSIIKAIEASNGNELTIKRNIDLG